MVNAYYLVALSYDSPKIAKAVKTFTLTLCEASSESQ